LCSGWRGDFDFGGRESGREMGTVMGLGWRGKEDWVGRGDRCLDRQCIWALGGIDGALVGM
jgi:hypothetical protein